MNQRWTVSDEDAGLRLDKFLAAPDRLGSRSRAVTALERGRIYVNEAARENSRKDARWRLSPSPPPSFLKSTTSWDSNRSSDRGINIEKYRSFELYRRHTHRPEIITFDELSPRSNHREHRSGTPAGLSLVPVEPGASANTPRAQG
jgi:hypothetical protein